MSPKTTTTPPALEDDPLGGVLLEPEMTFGRRAAILAGNAPEVPGPGAWQELIQSIGCSIWLTPPEPDQLDRLAFDG